MIQTTVISFDSPEYHAARSFRAKILREPLGLQYTDEDFENDRQDIHMVLLIDGAIKGTLQLTNVDTETYKMRQVCIASELQGKGMGKKLVLASEQLALKHGKKRIILNARVYAQPFYESLQYVSFGDEFLEVGIPHTKMKKELK